MRRRRVHSSGCQLCKSVMIDPRQANIPGFQNVPSTAIHEAPHWKPPKYPSRTKQIHRWWRGHGGGGGGGRSTVQCRCPRGFHIPSLLGGQDSCSQGPPPGPQTYGTPPTCGAGEILEVGLRRTGRPGPVTANVIPLSPESSYSLPETLIMIKTANPPWLLG